MSKNRKIIITLILLSATAAFSTTSISTNYLPTVHTSLIECLPDAPSIGILNYTQQGVMNESLDKSAVATCPVKLDAPGKSYTINAVVSANARSKGGSVQCELNEVDSLNGKIVKTYSNSANVDTDSTAPLTWYDIKRTANGVFNVKCTLPPNTSLLSISVT